MDTISKSIKDTEKIARVFVKDLMSNNFIKNPKATIVGLYGNLGVGKTAFTKIVAREFGIKRKVNSPTFVIMKKYPISKNFPYKKFKYFIHMDAYRLKNEKELVHLGWNEIISKKEHLVFIEWPEQIKKAIPKKHHQIHIKHVKEEERKFKIKLI
jgi:tRNA threonylcarbamoyladenosine biosynthesis protein TsaE